MHPFRRRSPQWVRDMSHRDVHAVAIRLLNSQHFADWTPGQRWLWEALVSELEYRRRSARWPDRKCSCELCFGPFDDDLST